MAYEGAFCLSSLPAQVFHLLHHLRLFGEARKTDESGPEGKEREAEQEAGKSGSEEACTTSIRPVRQVSCTSPIFSSHQPGRDHSGSIEFEELLEVLALMETAVSEEEAVRIMQVADKDGSGQVLLVLALLRSDRWQISFDEFCEVIGLGSSESDNSWKGMLGDLHLGTQGVGEGTGVGGCNVGMGIGHIRHLARKFDDDGELDMSLVCVRKLQGRKPKKESDVQISAREENEAKSMMISSRWIHLSSRLKKWLRRLKLNKKNHKFPEQQPAQPNVMAAEPTPKKSRDVKLFRLSVSSRVMISDSPSLEKQNDRRSITVDHSEEQEKNMESHRLLKFISGDSNS
eukprot:758421-Hanusia_phi.AAC.1